MEHTLMFFAVGFPGKIPFIIRTAELLFFVNCFNMFV